jgi:hypothetical protein
MKRKTVVFYIENENKVISEFNENIPLLYLKIFIRDRTNIKNFDFYHKKKLLVNNTTPLYKFCQNKNQKTIKFFLKMKCETDRSNYQLETPNNENEIILTGRNKLRNKQKIKLYEEEISNAIEKNNELKNNINKYKENINECLKKENKNKEKYLSIENLLIKQKEEINLLKNKINDANRKYNILKNKSIEKENRIKKDLLKYHLKILKLLRKLHLTMIYIQDVQDG